MKRLLICLLLAAALITSACALEVPTDTTVKDGVTLNLSNVDWQVIGTDQVGDALAPSSYQAVATYSGKSYTKAATGGGGYGTGDGPAFTLPPELTVPTIPTYQPPAYTSVEGMAYKDGHIGTIQIPSV